MSLPAFTINLGNGLHIDSSGKLTMDVPSNVPEFSLSQPVGIPSTAVQQVFGGAGSVVPQLEKLGADFFVKDWDVFKAFGLSAEFAKTLGQFATIATTLASVIPYVNMAVGLLSMLGVFSGSGQGMNQVIEEECRKLSDRIDAIETQNFKNFATDCTSKFSSALPELSSYRTELVKPKRYRGPGEFERQREQLQARLTLVRDKLFELLDRDWQRPFNPGHYFNRWSYFQTILHTFPQSGAPKPALQPASGLAFDHILMLPVVMYGIQIYLTVAKTLVPEYRTADKTVRESLRLIADKLASKLDDMREQTLALTIYKAKAGEPYFKVTSRQMYVLPVGAMDLRADTDFGPAPNLNDLWTPGPGIDTRGTQVEVDGDEWWTINPAAIELADRQAERDYAALLSRTGYFSLAHLECLMRHLSSEPDRSETVTGKAETLRRPLAPFRDKVRNDQIPFSDPIEADVSREPQECKAYMTLTTQTVPSNIAIGYRVRLITLPDGEQETPFSAYVSNSYVPDGDSRNWKLQVFENSTVPLDPVGRNERLLADNISPSEPIQAEETIPLTADTFDWYVPVPDNPIRIEQIHDNIRVFGSANGAKPIPMPPAGPGTGPGLSRWNIEAEVKHPVGVGFGWDEGKEKWRGEKREWRRTEILLSYKLHWHEDQLTISLKADPKYRNFRVYLVVEEFLADSQQWLRTPVQVLFTGQLTYVPESFFEAENKAWKHASEVIKRIEQNYRKSRKPGPTDPVVGWLRSGTLASVSARQEFVNLARQHAPEVVEASLAPLAKTASTD